MKLLFDFGAVLFVSLLLGSIAEQLGLSSVIGYLISGYILGPQGLNFVHDSDLISLFADLGIILLLFFTGLKMNPKKFAEAGAYTIFLSPAKSGAVFLVGYFIGKLLGMTPLESFIIGAGLAGSSTAIISHAILKHGWDKKKEARIALSMLVLEDLLSVFFIAYLMGMLNVEVPVSKILFHTFALAFITFTVGTYLIIRVFKLLSPFMEESHWPLYTLGLITLFAYGVSLLGISPIIGAFFAGLAMASTKLAEPLYRKMAEYKHFFALFFFTSLGLKYSISFSTTALLLALLFSLAVWVQVLVVLLLGPFLGLEPERAFRLGVLMLPVGEFSLFFSAVAQELGLPHGADIMGGFFLAMIITTTVGSYMIRKEKYLEGLVERAIPEWIRNRFDPYFLASNQLFASGTMALPENSRRMLLFFLVSYISFYFTGYLLTNHLVGFAGYLIFYVFSSLLLALFLVELKGALDDILEAFFGFAKKKRPVGLSSLVLGITSLFLGAFLYFMSESFSVVSFFLMSFAFLFFGLVLALYGLLRLTLFPSTH